MSARPGYWGTKEGEIPITAMEDAHVKHSLRYLRSKYLELREITVDTANRYQRFQFNTCIDKLCELGTEAQRRNLVPQGDIAFDQFLAIIEKWDIDWKLRKSSLNRAIATDKQKITPKLSGTEKMRLDKSSRILSEIALVTGLKEVVTNVVVEIEMINRRLDTDL